MLSDETLRDFQKRWDQTERLDTGQCGLIPASIPPEDRFRFLEICDGGQKRMFPYCWSKAWDMCFITERQLLLDPYELSSKILFGIRNAVILMYGLGRGSYYLGYFDYGKKPGWARGFQGSLWTVANGWDVTAKRVLVDEKQEEQDGI